MKPYKIIGINKWVDLDTIQSINEPIFLNNLGYGGFFVKLKWQHAFRDTHDEYNFEQESKVIYVGPEEHDVKPVLNENGEPTQLVHVRENIFKPFLDAWKNKDNLSDERKSL